MLPQRSLARGLVVLMFCWAACMKTQNVTVPVANEPAAACVERCRNLSGTRAYYCLRRCPDARVSDGACVVPAPACAEQRVIKGRTAAIVAGAVLALPLAFVVWYFVLDAGPTD